MTTCLETETRDETGTSDDVAHVVCHCTDDRIAWCSLDVSGTAWVDEGEEIDCPMCGLVADDNPDACPWGCCCDEC